MEAVHVANKKPSGCDESLVAALNPPDVVDRYLNWDADAPDVESQ